MARNPGASPNENNKSKIHIENQTGGDVNVKVTLDNPRKKPDHPYSKFAVVNILTEPNQALKTLGGLSILWQIAPDKELTGDCWRVLACLICKLDYENYLLVPQIDIANHLNISRTTVSRCIKILEAKNIVERGARIGNLPTFKFNPQFGWVGDNSNLKVALNRKLSLNRKPK